MSSSPTQDIRNKTTKGMYTHCDRFNNVILYPLAIRNNIIEGCTLSSMLGVISSSPTQDIRNKTTEGIDSPCDKFNNVILYPSAIRNNIIEGGTISLMLGVICPPT